MQTPWMLFFMFLVGAVTELNLSKAFRTHSVVVRDWSTNYDSSVIMFLNSGRRMH